MKINHPHLHFKGEISLRSCTRYVVVHHTEREHWTIHQWHKNHSNRKGWLGFGYHYFIDQKTCEIYEGRQRNEDGSHVKHYNDCTIGVCFDGDFNKIKIKDAQLRASVELIALLQLIYDAPLLRHSDFPGVKKTCPGTEFPFEPLKALVDEKKYELLKEVLELPVATCKGLSFKESLEKRNRTEYVTIHHAEAYGTIREVHQWWIKQGMAGVPYHYYIDKDGKVFEGRPRNTKGALARMINSRAVGIGLEGDFDKNPVNSKQWDSCVKLAALLEMLYRATSHRHSDFSMTNPTSPGKNFAFDVFRHEVRELKAAAVAALSKRLDGDMPARQMPPLTFIPKSKYDAAANHPDKYIPLLKGKKVGVVCNPTSIAEDVHLVDFLRSKSVDVVKIFAPEHGFRGDADAGARVNDGKDSRTGLPIISLFKKGANKPSAETLKDVDVILFDIQDVGVRFYTYLTNLVDMMEVAAENGKPFILLDRPNPNGFYVDGPVLQPQYASFVGRTPVPIVYGMTIGEYATMVNEEGWLKNKVHCNLTVVWLENYNRHAIYELPVKPSPNLPDWQSVYLYPSLCLFEGTIVSVGRGTNHPFHGYGHPEMHGAYSFVPTSMPGAQHPMYENECCRGDSLESFAKDFKIVEDCLHLEWLRDAYLQLKDKDFFTSYFLKLAGTPELQEDIMADKTIEDIQLSWQRGIHDFMVKIRGKYLHYK